MHEVIYSITALIHLTSSLIELYTKIRKEKQ